MTNLLLRLAGRWVQRQARVSLERARLDPDNPQLCRRAAHTAAHAATVCWDARDIQTCNAWLDVANHFHCRLARAK